MMHLQCNSQCKIKSSTWADILHTKWKRSVHSIQQTYGEWCSKPPHTRCSAIQDATTTMIATAAAKGTYQTETVEQHEQQRGWGATHGTCQSRYCIAALSGLGLCDGDNVYTVDWFEGHSLINGFFFVGISSVDTPCPSFFLPFPCRLQACEAGGSGSWFHDSSVVHLISVCPYLGFPEVHSSEPLWQESAAMGDVQASSPSLLLFIFSVPFVIYFYNAAYSRFQLGCALNREKSF